MNRLTWQLGVALAGVALVAAVLVSFARTAVITEVPDYGGAYVEGLAGFPQAMNPVLAGDDASRSVNALVFSGLTRMDGSGQPAPDLAQSWDVSADGKTYTFVLRADARWHDGGPVVADDVVYTIKTVQDPLYTGELGSYWRDVSVDKMDDRTVKLTLQKDSYSPFIEYTALGILPSHLLGTVSARDLPSHRFNLQPVGSGPFRLKDVKPDQITLEAAPGYYGVKPFLSRVVFRIYPNYKTILTALERDEVEGVPLVDPQDVGRISREKRATLYDAPQASLTLLFFNVAVAPVNDRGVRQAIAHALDRQKLIDVGRQGHGRRADGPVLPTSWAYNADVKRYDVDLSKARALLDAAGWKLESPEATVRTKDGKPLRLVLLTNDRRERVQLAEEIQRQLVAVGFDVEVQATGAGGLVQDFLLPRRYEMALFSWDFNGLDPDPYALWHSTQLAPQGLNVTGFNNRRSDELLERGRRITDRAERAKLYQEFQGVFAEELPGLPLFFPTYDFAISAKIRGVKAGVIASPADRFRNVSEWYAKTRREVVGRK